MSVQLSERAQMLIRAKNLGNIATLMPDGSPHVVPVWVDLDGDDILVNTAEGRQKLKNVRRDPRVALDVVNSENPYEMVTLRGHVVEVTSEGADAHIDKLANKYLGRDRYPFRQPGEQRVIIRIEPERVSDYR
ncbi:MAG: PPOX class F420-dependent oxidoreductase [Dehalococcoidia bacterium]|jgi:PPOX class probable F420-dependent enzyme|nr:PPOX class F420-dependent oxidoreductase [Dehalococcoidia bacterium]